MNYENLSEQIYNLINELDVCGLHLIADYSADYSPPYNYHGARYMKKGITICYSDYMNNTYNHMKRYDKSRHCFWFNCSQKELLILLQKTKEMKAFI